MVVFVAETIVRFCVSLAWLVLLPVQGDFRHGPGLSLTGTLLSSTAQLLMALIGHMPRGHIPCAAFDGRGSTGAVIDSTQQH